MNTTRSRFNFRGYHPSDFDDNFCLKPPLLLWLAVIYLSRAFLLPFMSGLASSSGSREIASLTRGLFSLQDFVPAAIALLIPLAFHWRKPSPAPVARWIWHRGRMILATAALIDLALSLFSVFREYTVQLMPSELPVLTAALDVYFLAYVVVAGRVRDVFRDFPQPLER
jgi:Protein of unknown function (DUF2919)